MRRAGAAQAAGALVLLGLWLALRSPAFYSGYLAAYVFWSCAPFGALAWLCCFQLTGGRWGKASFPALAAAAGTLPWLTLLFLPVAVGVPKLYPWTHVPAPSGPYLSAGWFFARVVVYFAVWNAVALLSRRARLPGAGGWLLGLGLVATFAGIDWCLSFDRQFKSTVYGLIIWTGQGLSAIALCGLCVGLALRGRELDEEESVVLGDVGNLLLAAVMLWAYVQFSQYLVVWSGNIPDEARWFLHRSHGAWRWAAQSGALAGFAMPFAFLLFRAIKRRPLGLAAVCALVLALRGVELAWLVLPDAPGGAARIWLYLACLAGLGAVWTPLFLDGLGGWMAPAGRPSADAREPA